MIVPQGKLIPIGGSENKNCHENGDCPVNFFKNGILKRILTEMKGRESRLEIIPTASSEPVEVTRKYLKAFKLLGCNNVRIMFIRDRKHAENPEYLERIENADGVFFTGGDQSRIVSAFAGTEFHKLMVRRYLNEDFVIAGTSAGAMAMSKVMIRGGKANSFINGTVEMGNGLGFTDKLIIDTHFIERSRFGRLTQAVAGYPGHIGIGLAEDTGMIITNGSHMEIIGSGQVVVMDGQYMNSAEPADKSDAGLLSLENLSVNILAMNDKYHLDHQYHSDEHVKTLSHSIPDAYIAYN